MVRLGTFLEIGGTGVFFEEHFKEKIAFCLLASSTWISFLTFSIKSFEKKNQTQSKD